MKRMVRGICAAVGLVLVLAGSARADKIGILWNGSYLLDPYSTITGLIAAAAGDNTTIQAPRLGGTGQDSSAWDACYPDLAGGVWGCDDNDTRMQRLIGLVIGTNVQAYSATLASLAGLTETAGGIPYGTADNTYGWLAAGATTEILVGGGAAAPVWTTATGTGAPVRAGSPTFTGVATSPTYANSGAVSVSPFSAAGGIYRAVASTITDTHTPGLRAVGAAYSFGVPTFAAENAITVTDAASLYLAGPPTAGANTTLTNAWTIYAALGNAYIKGTLYTGNSGFIVDDDGDVTAKSYTTAKVSNTATQMLLYGDNGTQTLGAGWMGPHDATARAASYFLQLPTAEPTSGQVLTAGTPSDHVSTMTWSTPGTGTMTTVSEEHAEVGSADVTQLNFGAGFDVADNETIAEITLESAVVRAGVTEITKYQYLPAAWFEDNATSPPAAAAVISGEEIKARLFADNETSVVLWQVDPEWSAGLKFRVYYSLVANGEADDTAIFRLKGCTIGNSEALTCTAGDPIGVTDEIGTDDDANELMITDWSDAVTLTGIAANELARLTFYRGSDDEAGELNVIGIELKYKAKVSAASDY